MSTLTSTISPSVNLISRQPETGISSNLRHDFSTSIRWAGMKLAHKFNVRWETFYEDHVVGIYLALFTEVAFGLIAGAITFMLYTRWMM